jgi:acyl-CoA reductase-like NAD-dependent aldehyde dehydrogenase
MTRYLLYVSPGGGLRGTIVLTIERASFESTNPATGEVVGRVDVMGPDDVRLAIGSARAAAQEFGALSLNERARHLRAVRQSLVDHGERLATTIAAETGKPLPDAWLEVFGACALLSYAASAAPKVLRTRSASTWPIVIKQAEVQYSPYGVIGVISPWNYPLVVSMQAIASALGAGNAVVLKPSELTSLTGVLLGDAVRAAGIDLVHVVTGDGAVGEAVVRGGVDKIAFTGSPLTGRRIMAAAADSLTPLVMELGGKDPMIVCEDADVSRAAKAAVAGAFSNAGQTCIAVERALVAAPVYDRFLDEVVAATSALRQGPEPDAHVGAITRPPQIEVIEARLADAVAHGARILTGGSRRKDLAGSFFAPTVVADVTPDMELVREETFGPVLPVIRVGSAEEAVAIANDCDYGLNASVFTRDRRAAAALAEQLVAGGVNVNDALLGAAIPSLPFGGEKWSGFGRVHGPEGLREFSRVKSVVGDRLPFGPSLAATMLRDARPTPELIARAIGVAYSNGLRKRLAALRG